MNVDGILVLLHMLSAGWFASGLVGRSVAWRHGRAAGNAATAIALLTLSDHFERLMVIPGSMAVLIFGLLAAWWGGWPIFGFLAGDDENWLLVSLVLYLSPVPFIPLYLAPRRKLRNRLLEQARADRTLSAELTAALNDRGVAVYRRAEYIVILAVTTLMVTKPF